METHPSAGSRRVGRRGLLAGAATLAAAGACAPALPGNGATPSEIYVGLGRARQVAILDAVTDRVVGRVPLMSSGERGAPAQITVEPSGSAAIIPLVSTSPSVGLIRQDDPPAERRARWLHLGSAHPPQYPNEALQSLYLPEAAQRLSADGQGRAYVVIADGGAHSPPEVAVFDMRTGSVQRRIQVAQLGETVLALLPDPEGNHLYVAIWDWGTSGPSVYPDVRGRLVALDAHTGAVLARAPLPENAAVTEMTIAAAPPGTPGAGGIPALYAMMATPGPLRDEVLHMGIDRQQALVALDLDTLDLRSIWRIDRPTGALAVLAEGTRAYVLASGGSSPQGVRALLCVDLSAGQAPGMHGMAIREWPLPEGCLAMTLSPVGKLYVADALGDRLWRFDVRRNVMLGPLALPGAPLTLATRPD